MIKILGKATSNEQGRSALTDLKNRRLITEDSYLLPPHKHNGENHNINMTTLLKDEDAKLVEQWLEKDNYLIILTCNQDDYSTIKELAEGLHGIGQIRKL